MAAAVLTDPWLADALVEKLRDNMRVVDVRGSEQFLPPGQFARLRLLQPKDLAVLVLVGFALAEDGEGVLGGFDPDRGLGDLDDVAGSLRRLSLAGLVTGSNEGELRFRVAWGDRALKIAREAGVPLPESEKVKAATA